MDDVEAAKDFMSGMKDGVTALGHTLNEGTQRVGVGKTEILAQPLTDSFGTFHEKKDYYVGCDIGEVIVNNGGIVTFTSEDNENVRVVEIGKVPPSYDPKTGGVLILEAGAPNDYLLAVFTRDKKTNNTKQSFRYVDGTEITGAVVEKGKQATLNPAEDQARQIAIQGTVSSVLSFR